MALQNYFSRGVGGGGQCTMVFVPESIIQSLCGPTYTCFKFLYQILKHCEQKNRKANRNMFMLLRASKHEFTLELSSILSERSLLGLLNDVQAELLVDGTTSQQFL